MRRAFRLRLAMPGRTCRYLFWLFWGFVDGLELPLFSVLLGFDCSVLPVEELFPLGVVAAAPELFPFGLLRLPLVPVLLFGLVFMFCSVLLPVP